MDQDKPGELPFFIESEQGLLLRTPQGDLHLDFLNDRHNYQRSFRRGKNEVFFRALGAKQKFYDLLDLTAGLGQDAVALAQHGWQVRAVERSPWIYPLLEDARKRALDKPDQAQWIQHLTFHFAEAKVFLQNLAVSAYPQVIYLDPMFPAAKKTALPRKEMQIFRHLIGGDADAAQLLPFCLQCATQRVVVKRPLHAPDLQSGVNHRFVGTTVRYDMYLPMPASQERT